MLATDCLQLGADQTSGFARTHRPASVRRSASSVCAWHSSRFLGTDKDSQLVLMPGQMLFNDSVVSDSLRSHGLQHTRLPCPLLSPRVCSNSCPLSQ